MYDTVKGSDWLGMSIMFFFGFLVIGNVNVSMKQLVCLPEYLGSFGWPNALSILSASSCLRRYICYAVLCLNSAIPY